MDADMKKALELLSSGDYTCAACRGDDEYTSRARGVKPLLDLIDDARSLAGYCVADRVVGRAAAYLYVELGAKAVHALMPSPTAPTPACARWRAPCGISPTPPRRSAPSAQS